MSSNNSDWNIPTKDQQSNNDWGFPAAKPSNNDEWGVFTNQPATPAPKGGRWQVVQTIILLVLVAVAAFLASFFTKEMSLRPAPLMGMMFAAPATALMFGALALESLTNAMTPRFSRKAQVMVALATSVTCFVMGCAGGFITKPTVKSANVDQYVLLLDRSGSITTTDPHLESAAALTAMVDDLPDGMQVGLVVFSHRILQSVSLAPLSPITREQIANAVQQLPEGGTDFTLPITLALDQLEASGLSTKKPTLIVMLTDGEYKIQDVNALAARCLALNARVSGVKLGTGQDATLTALIEQTGGINVEVAQATDLLQGLIEVSRVQEYDVLKEDSTLARTVSGTLFILQGILLGIALTVMLSQNRQKRLQLVLSPVMGVLAFLLLRQFPLFAGASAWMNEWLSFSLYGIVFMKKNR